MPSLRNSSSNQTSTQREAQMHPQIKGKAPTSQISRTQCTGARGKARTSRHSSRDHNNQRTSTHPNHKESAWQVIRISLRTKARSTVATRHQVFRRRRCRQHLRKQWAAATPRPCPRNRRLTHHKEVEAHRKCVGSKTTSCSSSSINSKCLSNCTLLLRR